MLLYSLSEVKPRLIAIIQPWLNPDKQILLFSKSNSSFISIINLFNTFSAFMDSSKI